jgi:hypothetical protein
MACKGVGLVSASRRVGGGVGVLSNGEGMAGVASTGAQLVKGDRLKTHAARSEKPIPAIDPLRWSDPSRAEGGLRMPESP